MNKDVAKTLLTGIIPPSKWKLEPCSDERLVLRIGSFELTDWLDTPEQSNILLQFIYNACRMVEEDVHEIQR